MEKNGLVRYERSKYDGKLYHVFSFPPLYMMFFDRKTGKMKAYSEIFGKNEFDAVKKFLKKNGYRYNPTYNVWEKEV